MCCTAPAFPFQVRERLCSIADTEAISFQDLVTRLPNSTFLDLTTQTDVLDDALDEEITVWDPRSTRYPSTDRSFWPQQPDATSRLGPDLMPQSRSITTDDEMSVQEHETTHVPFTRPSASESIPPDVPVCSVPPEDSAQTMSSRRRWTVWNLRNVPEVTMMRIPHFSLHIIMIRRRCLKI